MPLRALLVTVVLVLLRLGVGVGRLGTRAPIVCVFGRAGLEPGRGVRRGAVVTPSRRATLWPAVVEMT